MTSPAWRKDHREANRLALDGKPARPLNKAHSQRLDHEFEMAVRQRGERARQAAIKRGEIQREAA